MNLMGDSFTVVGILWGFRQRHHQSTSKYKAQQIQWTNCRKSLWLCYLLPSILSDDPKCRMVTAFESSSDFRPVPLSGI